MILMDMDYHTLTLQVLYDIFPQLTIRASLLERKYFGNIN